MNSWAVQLLTLLAVALGALASFVSTRALDRSRWRREEALRWDTKRLEVYGDFASAIQRHINIAWRVCAGIGLPTTSQPLAAEVGLPALATAESELSVQFERILLLGSPDVTLAATNWRHEAWHLDWFARQLRSDTAEFVKATQDRREARRRFYSAARADLGVASGDIPAEVEETDAWWRQRDGELPGVS
jgi:hypothetical protein